MEDLEDSAYVASEHDRLVSAISKLDKTQHITEPTRNEPTNVNSEFNLIKHSNKLNLSNVAKILGDTAVHVNITKKLRKTQDGNRVLSKPLEKPQAERIKRATGYEETKKKVGRWDPVVARSRTVDYVSFPLKHVSTKLQPTGEFLSKFKLKSELEKELEEIDPPPMEVEEEEDQVFPMTFEEMVEHRQHSAKMRAQQSYNAAKAKRQSKIKSKKYHRVLKKEKLKQQLKEFEELQQKDPEEALKKLEAIEKARALERHTLRHKNTGKWAKNKMIRAKYDKDVRQELAEQLAVSRSLTQKVEDNDSTDEEDDDNVTTNIALAQDPLNPWMMQRSDKSIVNSEFDFGYKKFVQDKMFKRKDESDSESNDDTEEANDCTNSELSVLKQSIKTLSKREYQADIQLNENPNNKTQTITEKKQIPPKDTVTTVTTNQQKQIKRKNQDIKLTKKASASKIKKPVSTSNWIVESVPLSKPLINNNEFDNKEEITSAFEDHESTVAQQVEKKLKEIRRNLEQLEKDSKTNVNKRNKTKNIPDHDSLEYLMFKNKKKAVIDEELIETSKTVHEQKEDKSDENILQISKAASTSVQESGESNIDPNRFIEVKPKYLNTAVSEGTNNYDQLDDDDEQVVPKVNIEEVFEEDDVVASFRQEKEDEINKDKPEDINLTLPGWGAWGGKGVKAPKRKRNRFITKLAPKIPRRDDNKGDIIIKEYKEPKLAVHKIKEIPFPFESVKDYEASIRAPLGNTFIPEKAHKKLVRPSVITKAGTIIEPIDEYELLVPKNRSFKNDAVIKLLGQK